MNFLQTCLFFGVIVILNLLICRYFAVLLDPYVKKQERITEAEKHMAKKLDETMGEWKQ